MKPFRKVAFVVNEDKAGAPELAKELMSAARKVGVELSVTSQFPLPTDLLQG